MYVHDENLDKLLSKDNDDDNKTEFNKGDKYILVDAGGGTTDIACHEIFGEKDGDFGTKEINHLSGGPWGSCYIDDRYVQLLKDIFSDEWVNEFISSHPDTYIHLLHEFQKSEQSFYAQMDVTKTTHNIKLPQVFMTFMQDKLEEEYEDVEDDSDEDELSHKMFDYVVNPCIEHVEKLLTETEKMEECKYLCPVGGL